MEKYKDYLYKLPSMKRMCRIKNVRISNKQDLKNNMENIRIFVRGHNLLIFSMEDTEMMLRQRFLRNI